MNVNKVTGVYYASPKKRGFNELTALGSAKNTTIFCDDEGLENGWLYNVFFDKEYDFDKIGKDNQPLIRGYKKICKATTVTEETIKRLFKRKSK